MPLDTGEAPDPAPRASPGQRWDDFRRRRLGGVAAAWARTGPPRERIAGAAYTAAAPLRRLQAALGRTRLVRFFASSLARRIFVFNLIGLGVLLFGIVTLSQHQDWLIAAKRESLRVQGEIIAAAIAANAAIDGDGLTLDAGRLSERPSIVARDDGLAAYALPLRPDQVGPVLRRLIKPTHNTRARVYDRDGEFVVDSQLGGRSLPVSKQEENVRAKSNWTRVVSWFDGSDLPLYNEIGHANGTKYKEVRQALRGELPEPALLLAPNGKIIVSLAVPIQRRNSTLGAVLLSTRPGEIDSILAKERRIILAVTVMALLTTLMASLMLARTIARPLHLLSGAADQVTQSINARTALPDYSQREDEVGQLAETFRRMTEALYQRIEAADAFAADVAHELKNPLAAMRVLIDTLATYAKTPEQREAMIKEIQAELQRLNRLISDVSEASRLEADIQRQTNEPVDLSRVLSDVVDVLSDLHADKDRHIALQVDEAAKRNGDLLVFGHAVRLSRVVTNLVDNALSFSPPGGVVRVTAGLVGPEIEMRVEDTGPGMPDDKLEKIFERFYSDRPESDQTIGKNSGLGLSITRLIVNGHGGRIWAENIYRDGARPGREGAKPVGARFVVRLPAGNPVTMPRMGGGAARRG